MERYSQQAVNYLIEDVIRTADAVASGATTFGEIAQRIGKVDRQGRYYRLAAQILGSPVQ